MPQLNFITWLPYLATCWLTFFIMFLLLNSLNESQWFPKATSPENQTNSFQWPWPL